MPFPFKQLALVAFVAVAVIGGGILYPLWRTAVERNQDARADPHHIAGNLYFVGTPSVTSFLLIGPEGHVVIGGGDRRPRKILDNIEQLGFDIRDVRILLATGPHMEEAGGFAALQQASGAELWASEANAQVISSGGAHDASVVYPPYRLFAYAGILTYDIPHVDHRIVDGETVRLGPLALTARITPGHAPGCTTWTFMVRDGDRDLHVVYRCTLTPPIGASLVDPERYPGIRGDFERSFLTLRGLPVDIWLSTYGREYGRFRKYQESLGAEDPVAPFIDPEGYAESLDQAEGAFRTLLDEQQHP